MNEKKKTEEVKIDLSKPVGYKYEQYTCKDCPYDDRTRDCFMCRRAR